MLVLKRAEGERIYIGDDIVVTFAGMDGRKAMIGIDAPKHVRILREEIYEVRRNQPTTEQKS